MSFSEIDGFSLPFGLPLCIHGHIQYCRGYSDSGYSDSDVPPRFPFPFFFFKLHALKQYLQTKQNKNTQTNPYIQKFCHGYFTQISPS